MSKTGSIQKINHFTVVDLGPVYMEVGHPKKVR